MKLIPPSAFELTASNVTETLYSEYASGTTYASGTKVYVTLESDGTTERTPHKIYESLQSSNTGHYPPDNTSYWLDSGATNKWSMFDDYVSSTTDNSGTIEITVTPTGYVDTLTLINLTATSVDVVCKSDGTTISLRRLRSTIR